MSFQDNVSITTTILNALTWKRLFRLFLVITFLVIVILASMNFSWFQKKPAFREDENIKLLVVSTPVAAKMAEIHKKMPTVVGVQVITLNFHKNIRIETYISISNPIVQQAYNAYISNKVYETLIFTTDKTNNTRILHIINGEFICGTYKNSTAYKYAPSLDQVYITDVCAVGIPPYNSDASGILTFYFSAPLTDEDKKNIFLFARDISTQIYIDSNK